MWSCLHGCRRLLGRLTRPLIVAAILILTWGGMLAASSTGDAPQAGPPGQDASGISAQARAQIGALIADKANRTPVQRKIDSQLLFAGRMARREAIASGVQTLDVSVPMTADGRVMLDVRADVSDVLLGQLRGLGAEITETWPQYRAIGLNIALDQVEAIAALAGVSFVNPKPERIAWGRPDTADGRSREWIQQKEALIARKRPSREGLLSAVQRAIEGQAPGTNVGSKQSEGDATHKAANARTTYGIDGTGVKIGVLSDGVTNLAMSQASGDLGVVTVLAGQTGTGDEGTAMLEIIHDLAPGAQLYFATAFSGISSFAQNIRDLRTAGCDIIVDDVFYYVESPFQDGQTYTSQYNGAVVIQAVKDVTAAGALFFSSAGNSGNLNDGTSGTWEGDFVDGGAVSGPIGTAEGGVGRFHSFGVQTYTAFTTNNTNPINLYWSDPLGTSANDYDLFVLNSTGTTILGSSLNIQSGTQDPYEHVSGSGFGSCTGCRVVIVQYSGSGRFLHLGTNRRRVSIATTGETHGHSSTTAANSFSVAATPAIAPGPYPSPFNGTNKVETFSSDGPRRIFYNSSGTAITPGNVSATGGQVLNKPDLTAADGVSVTGTGGTFPSTFYGTSAAAPHAGAIAALAKSRQLAATASQITAALVASAIDIEAAGNDRDSGVGIIMADTAVGAMSTAFTDDPLVVGSTVVKAVHVTELRTRIDALRTRFSLPAATWTDPTLTAGASTVKAVHITEMRTALAQAYTAAFRTAPTYTDPTLTAASSVVKAVHIAELRAAVIALE